MFDRVKFYFVIAALCGVFATLCGKEIFVSVNGNDRNPGSAVEPLATINAAAKRAAAGDTVKIAPGIYREQITFRKSGKKES